MTVELGSALTIKIGTFQLWFGDGGNESESCREKIPTFCSGVRHGEDDITSALSAMKIDVADDELALVVEFPGATRSTSGGCPHFLG